MSSYRSSQLVIATLMLCAASIAASQIGPVNSPALRYGIHLRGADVPHSTAQYYFYSRLVQESRAGSRAQLLATVRSRLALDETQLESLLAHMRDTINKAHSYEVGLQQGLCARFASFTSSTQIGEAYLDNERRVDVRRAELMQGLADVLDASQLQAFDALVLEYRADLTIDRYDYTRFHAEHPEAMGEPLECSGGIRRGI